MPNSEAERDLDGKTHPNQRKRPNHLFNGIDPFSGTGLFSGTNISEGACNRSDLEAVK